MPTGYAYDSQGNITARGSRGYYFDQGNRMTLAGVASYTYDGLGRRTSISDGNGYRVQVYGQAGQLLYGMQQQGMVVKNTRYVHLAGKQIAETNSATGTTFVHTDALGSPVARTNAAGDLTRIDRTRYEAYGNTAAGTIPNGIGFTGDVNDPDTGLVYMQQRYYDPIAGRFQSVDPIVTNANTGQSFGRYVYALNNPYIHVDPDGRAAETVILPAVVVGGAALTTEPVKQAATKVVGAVVEGVQAATVAAKQALGSVIAAVRGVENADAGIDSKGADSAGSKVRDNRSKGQKAEGEVAADLEGAGRDVDRQVREDTPFGPRVIDVEVKDKDGNVLGGVEVKSGKGRYRPDQRSKDEWLRQNGYPVDLVRKP